MPGRRPALLLPFGLKSWLNAVTQAVLSEQPQHVTEFIATYCQQLHQFRKEYPRLNLHDLAELFREVREGGSVSRSSSLRSFPSSSKHITSLSPQRLSQMQDMEGEKEGSQGPAESEDLMTREMSSAIQSALFQRSSPSCHVELIKNTVVICKTPSPSDQVIVIHSTRLPDAIVFHKNGVDSLGSCSLFRSPTSEQGGGWDEGAFADVVIYNKVPSIEDLPYQLSISEDHPSTPVAQSTHSEGAAQGIAAQKQISDLDLSDTAPAEPIQGIQEEMAESAEQASETEEKRKSLSPQISFATVHKQVSDTAVGKCLLGMLADSNKMANLPNNRSRSADNLTASDWPATMLNIPVFVASKAQPLNAKVLPARLQDAVKELPEQSPEKDKKQYLATSPSDAPLTEAANSAVSDLIDRLLVRDFCETCEGAPEAEKVEGSDSEPAEAPPHEHDTEKYESVCPTSPEPSLEPFMTGLCEGSAEGILIEAEMEQSLPADWVDHHDTSCETTEPLESPGEEQTLRLSPEQLLTEQPISAEHHSESALECPQLEVPEASDEEGSALEHGQQIIAEIHNHGELEHPEQDTDEAPEPSLEKYDSAVEHNLESGESTDEQGIDAEIHERDEPSEQDTDKAPDTSPEKHDSGSVHLSASEKFEEETEEHTASIPEKDDGSAVELLQMTEGELSAENIFSSHSAHQLAEKSSVALGALEPHSSEGPSVVEEPEEILSKAEIDLQEAPEVPEKVSPDSFVTDGTITAASAFKQIPSTVEQPDDAESHQMGDVSEPSVQEHDSADQLLESSSLIAIGALESHDNEQPSLRGEREELPEAETELEHGMDHQEETQLERAQKETQFLTDVSGMATGSIYPQHEVPESRLEEQDPDEAEALLSVPKTEEETSGSSAEEETASSSAHAEICSDESAHELHPTAEDEQLSSERTPSHTETTQNQPLTDTLLAAVSTTDGPALESSDSQVWTLYHLAQASDSGTLPLRSPQFSASSSEHDLVTEKLSRDHDVENQKEQEFTSPQFTAEAEGISIPNYVLITAEEKATREKSVSEKEACEKDQKPQAQKGPRIPGFFSFTLPMDDLCEARCSSQAQILQVTSSDGNAVYSPGIVRVLCTTEDTPEPRSDIQATPSGTDGNVEWTLKISIKQHFRSDTEKHKTQDFKKDVF